MATKKITELTELSVQPANNDVVAIVDIDADVTKKITISNLQKSSFPFTGSAIISGSLEVQGDFNPHPANLSSNNIGIGLVNNNLTGGSYNVFIGNEAGKYGSLPQNNVAIGRNAGFALGTGQNNVFVGYRAGYANGTTGASYTPNNNTAVGAFALDNMLSGDYNVALGYRAGDAVTGAGNLMIGYEAGASLSSGDGNIFIGSGSLGADTPSNQLRIGNSNSFTLISGSLSDGGILIQGQVSASSYIGDGSGLTGLSTGTPTFIGSGSTSASADPNNGVVVNASGSTLFDVRGSLGSLFSVTDSFDGNLFEVNNISGISLLSVSSSGDVDIPKGVLTVSGSVSASKFLGDGSQLTNLPASNPFPISGSVVAITGSLSISGSNSDFLLFETPINKLEINSGNIKIGRDAGISVSDNRQVIFIGHQAGYTTTACSRNIGIGTYAGYGIGNNSGATDNVFLGSYAGAGGSSPTMAAGVKVNNVGVGSYALLQVSTGDTNVAVGSSTLRLLTGGNDNVALGNNALYKTSTGDSNIGIGRSAGLEQTTGTGNITIGSGSLGVAGESNQLRIGTIIADRDPLIHGDFDSGSITFNVSGSDAFQVVGTEGTLFAVDDDLDGVIFTANDRTGLPVLQAEADGEVYLGKTPQSLYTTAVVSATSASSTASLIALSTSSYDSAYFDFTCTSASNSTVGSIMSTWNGETIAFNEYATSSIGTAYRTAGLDLQVIISASQAQLVAITDSTSPNTWKVKTTVRAI